MNEFLSLENHMLLYDHLQISLKARKIKILHEIKINLLY